MPYQRNAFYQTPNADQGFGQAASTLAEAFFPDPARGVQIRNAVLQGNLAGEKILDAQSRRQYTNSGADLLGQGDIQGALAEIFRTGDADLLRRAPEFTRAHYASGDPTAVDQQRLSNMVVGTGGQYQNTQLGQQFLEEQEGMRNAADNTRALQQTGITAAASRYGADQSAAASRYGADQRLVGQRYSADTTAEAIKPPTTIESALVRMAGQDGTIQLPNGQTTDLGALFTERNAKTGRDVATINPKDLEAAIGSVESGDFPLSAEAYATVAQRTSELMRSDDPALRNNPVAAAAAAMQELGPQMQQSGNWNPFSSNETRLQPPAMPEPRMPGPRPEAEMLAKPGVQLPPGIPPAEQREVGKVYDTPRGPMIWRGNGWTPAGA